MGKAVLILAFASAGMNFIALRLGNAFLAQSPLLINVALCVPAAALGAVSWLMTRSFARTWPVVVCVLIAWVGLLYAFEIEKNRGIVGASYLAMALPIGALIVQERCWWLCAKAYVLSNVAAMALALWFEYQAMGPHFNPSSFRFGFLFAENGMRQANPNVVGGQLAFATLLAFMLYLRGSAPAGDESSADGKRFSLGYTFFLSMGVLLTASRGAFIAWAAGLGVMWFWGSRTSDNDKLKNLVAVSLLVLTMTGFAAAATGFAPWSTLQNRIGRVGNTLASPMGRMSLWQRAISVWWNEPKYFLIGTGTGVAPDVLGEYSGYVMEDGVTVAAADAHNGFVEWMLSFGLIGILAGACLLLAVWRKAFQLDRRHGSVSRRAVLLCFSLISMYYVTFYQLLFVAAGSLILAMLSEPPECGTVAQPASREKPSPRIRFCRPYAERGLA